ncbi:insulin receptor substrate 1-B [Galendromus occidentalis]|uniref:Insulin receptor substrate 1 n=1 Tax=Galendromus occidentalis TaxID=34638 RepID=A0AAJ7L4A4_9ACAR|nr:insulin receptor substrate 1-B [Galendromus occidentalis]
MCGNEAIHAGVDGLENQMRSRRHASNNHAGAPVVAVAEKAISIHKTGYLKKIKTGKRRYFVLHSGSADGTQPRLDYFENEKKYKSGVEPKKSINVRNCFSINKKHDHKGRIVLALYTRQDCFALQCADTEEQDRWWQALVRLQQEGHLIPDQQPRPNFEHIWEVNIKDKGLGNQRVPLGSHRLCLTARTLSLVRMERESSNNQGHASSSDADGSNVLDFPLNSIRRCGHTDCFFFMELGRSSITGAGELWMQTGDTVIAQNMHEVLLSAMKSSKSNEDLHRERSSSTSENTNSVAIPRLPGQFMVGTALGSSPHSGQGSSLGSTGASPRDRSDSLPNRSRQNSDFNSHPMHSRCNTMDCTHVMHPQPFHWPVGPSTSPIGQLHNHSSVESCTELESSPHQPVPRNHLHINVTHPLDPHTIAEEQENPDYIAMNSPCGAGGCGDQTDTGSLIPSPVTLTDGGPSSHSSHCGTASYLPHQSSTSSTEFMKMSPTHDGSSSHQNSNNNNNNNTDSSYMSMSPVGSSAASIDLLNGTGTLPNGYVPMMAMSSVANLGLHKSNNSEASPTSPPGYMEMAPLSSSLPKSVGGFNSSWGSSIHSLHETSPTFGLNLEGFHLDKVKSFIAPSTDDDNSIRTGRSYSVGKRPKEPLSNTERVRAYSVGSQAYPPALAAKKRQQQHQQDILATPTSDRGRSNSYSKKSSSTSTLGGSRHEEEEKDLMEITYDENWHRTTAAAAAAGAAAAAVTSHSHSLPSGGSTSINNNNNYDSDYLPMRVNYKEPEPMKLFPVNEIDVSPPQVKDSVQQNDFSTVMLSKKVPNPDYMDLSCGPMSPPQSVPQMPASRATPDSDGEYVSIDMSRPFPSRLSSNPIIGGPEPKKSKSASTLDPTTPMTTQHNYENLSFGANGATVEAVSSQEPMDTDSKPSTAVASAVVPSVSSVSNGSHHELNYAALDLSPPTCEEPPTSRPLPLGCSAMELTTSNPSGVAYSEVDFRKSEGLRGSLIREGPRV